MDRFKRLGSILVAVSLSLILVTTFSFAENENTDGAVQSNEETVQELGETTKSELEEDEAGSLQAEGQSETAGEDVKTDEIPVIDVDQADTESAAESVMEEPALKEDDSEAEPSREALNRNINDDNAVAASRAPAIIASGEYWSLNNSGVLELSDMKDYPNETSIPWYKNRVDIREVVFTEDVNFIGNYAFWGCYNLSSITIPDSVTRLGNYAFYLCSNLTSITLPDGVTSIGTSTFADCSDLTSINIPDSVTSIGYRAFYFCERLTSIIIPGGVTSISNNAFEWCMKLTDVTIMEGVTNIGNYAFSFCYDLKNITIPDSLTRVGNSAFAFCSDLESVTFPNGVQNIGSYVFEECRHLKTVTMPESMADIGTGAFYNCSSLENITIPHGVKRLDGTFNGCSSLQSITVPETVTRIGENAFSDCSRLTGVSIPGGVTNLGNYAFYNCSSLQNITIPVTVTKIGGNVFSGCSSLTRIDIPSGVTSIGGGAFASCSKLTTVTIPNGVTSIEWSLFYHCSNLKSVTIPSGVTMIRDDAFSGCTSLTSIKVPGKVTYIGKKAFADCSNLGYIVIPKSVTKIGYFAFKNDSKLRYIFYGGDKTQWTAAGKDDRPKAGAYDDEGDDQPKYGANNAVIHYSSAGHTWKTYLKKATDTAAGSKTTRCTVCNATKPNSTETYPKIAKPTGTVTIQNTVANSAKKTNDVIWNKSNVQNAKNYQIAWRAMGETWTGNWAYRVVGDVNRGQTTGLTIGQLYEIKVRPCTVTSTSEAYGPWSKSVYRYFKTTGGVKITSNSKGTFTMSWTRDPKATSYQVLYTTNSNGSGAAQNIKTAGASATSITVRDIKVNGKTQALKSGTTYYVQIREVRTVGGKNYIGNISCPVAVKVK